jgi:DNA-3-methyladenine glycosylase
MWACRLCSNRSFWKRSELFVDWTWNLKRATKNAIVPTDKRLGHAFFRRPAIVLAADLIGTILVRKFGRKKYRARIVETEAYIGPHDLACHASKGRTRRTEVMFGPAGRAYVYLIYGMYEMFNIVASEPDDAQAVLIRAAEPLDGWTADLSGPGKLTRELHITRAENGLDLTGDKLYLTADPTYQARIARTKRIGIDYAKEWAHELFRFIDLKSSAVSKPRGEEARGVS